MNHPLTPAVEAANEFVNRGGLPISIYPPREITEDLQHFKVFTTGDTVRTMSALAKNLGLSTNQIGRLCFEIGLAVAPTLMAMQKHHEDTLALAIIAAKREHGRKVRAAKTKKAKSAKRR